MHQDPLLSYEQISSSHTHTKTNPYLRGLKFLSLYLLLTGGIFSILMGVLNFSAYSAVIGNWVNPEFLEEQKSKLETALLGNVMTVEAADLGESTDKETLKSKLAMTDPEMIYSRSYGADGLLGNISERQSKATFSLAPYENRIIIPKLGKNIPLVEVEHDTNAAYGELQDIFMEELKKGVVRYPGTARPGEVGNAFIFGHSSNYPWIQSEYNDVFALIDTLATGDEIIVYYNQKKYTYKITDRSIVTPGDTEVLSRRDPAKKEISIMTCWPVGTALERYIIFGELIETP